MARRAVWRLGPNDPASLAGLLRSGFSGKSSRALLICFALAIPVWLSWTLPLVLIILLLLPFALASPHPPRGSSARIATLPRIPGSYPVHVVVLVGKAVMGRDDATASFVDGWLYVEGVRASFSLRAQDGRPWYATFSPALLIRLHDGTLVRLEHVPEKGEGSGAFHADGKAWIEAQERPSGDSILPPRNVQPMVVAWGFVRTVLLAATALMVVTALFMDPSSGIMPFRVRPLSLEAILMLVVPPFAPVAWFAYVLVQARSVAMRPPHPSPVEAEEPSPLASTTPHDPIEVAERLEIRPRG